MIHPYDNETQTRWDRGGLQVQLVLPNNPKPVGFCDGTEDDMKELMRIAEAEGAEGVQVAKKRLKSGREIWTIGVEASASDEFPDD